jgi:L-fucose isomerase-like protein
MNESAIYGEKEAPVIGFIMVTLEGEFDKSLKEIVKNNYKALFESYKNNGHISKNSLFFDYCYDEKDIIKACEKMLDTRVEGIVYHPLSWPASETISSLATFRYLKDIPIFVSASPEILPENAKYPCNWPLNSDCGKIFAKSIFYKLDRQNLWATGTPDDTIYQKELTDFFTVCRLVKKIKSSKVVVVGNILDDFPESFYNPTTVRREIGSKIIEIDSAVLFTLFETGSYDARGLKIDENESEQYIKNLKKVLKINVEDSVLAKSTRAYLSYKNILESLAADAAIFRCAPEWVEKHGIVVCGVMSELIDNGVISSGGCEGDVLNTVTGLLQYYASGEPTTCLDWIDKPGAAGEGVYNLLHCGNACKSMLSPGEGVADYHQAWTTSSLGYTIEGPIKKGPVTVARIRENREGQLEMLIAEGQSVTNEMRIRGNYGLVDFGKERLARLVYEINENGWPHHLSLGWGHHGSILEKAVRFLGKIKIVKI